MNIVEEFRKVRDIPYRIPLSFEEANNCCSGKSERLFRAFKEAGYEVRYRVCAFLWSDLRLPKDLQALPHDDESTHSYIEVKIGKAWVVVDPTWDGGLRDLFAVNDWDGKSDTNIAVPVQRCLTLGESAQIMKEDLSTDVINEDLEKNGVFYKGFNEWLEKNRKKGIQNL